MKLTDKEFEILGKSNMIDLKEEKEKTGNNLKDAYRNIVDILKEYVDMNEEYYSLIAIWIIGTYFQDKFPSYPYLFINAMRGSGKTRLLKIIKTLSKEGVMLNSLTEAVLFRTQGTLCIDEFEGVNRKGNESLRELLNSAYKKGTKVKRMKKKKTLEGEEQVVEEFDVYRPIALANIWGMENVLSDRCVTLILEKSDKKEVINLIEIFEYDKMTTETRDLLTSISSGKGVVSVDVVSPGNIYKIYQEWNNYIKHNYTNYINNINNIKYINNTFPFLDFKKLKFAGIDGRHLELTLPLVFISSLFGEEDKIITTLKKIMDEKREEDITENMDISLFSFFSQEIENNNFVTVKQWCRRFKEFLQSDDEWINPKWLGRALKRLNLIKERRRQKQGVEVIIDYKKAQEKIKMFK